MEEPEVWLQATQVIQSSQEMEGGDEVGVIVVGRLVVGGVLHTVGRGQTTVGRNPESHIVLQHNTVSNSHAVIEAEIGGVSIHDVGSSNGTKKDGIKLKPFVRYNLDPGARIMFGNCAGVWMEDTKVVKDGCDGSFTWECPHSLLDGEEEILSSPTPLEDTLVSDTLKTLGMVRLPTLHTSSRNYNSKVLEMCNKNKGSNDHIKAETKNGDQMLHSNYNGVAEMEAILEKDTEPIDVEKSNTVNLEDMEDQVQSLKNGFGNCSIKNDKTTDNIDGSDENCASGIIRVRRRKNSVEQKTAEVNVVPDVKEVVADSLGPRYEEGEDSGPFLPDTDELACKEEHQDEDDIVMESQSDLTQENKNVFFDLFVKESDVEEEASKTEVENQLEQFGRGKRIKKPTEKAKFSQKLMSIKSSVTSISKETDKDLEKSHTELIMEPSRKPLKPKMTINVARGATSKIEKSFHNKPNMSLKSTRKYIDTKLGTEISDSRERKTRSRSALMGGRKSELEKGQGCDTRRDKPRNQNDCAVLDLISDESEAKPEKRVMRLRKRTVDKILAGCENKAGGMINRRSMKGVAQIESDDDIKTSVNVEKRETRGGVVRRSASVKIDTDPVLDQNKLNQHSVSIDSKLEHKDHFENQSDNNLKNQMIT